MATRSGSCSATTPSLIHDNVSGRDTVFNWGVFNFRQAHFIARISSKGRMLYAMGGDSMDLVMYAYRYLNRPVRSQELDLTPAQRDTILHRIQVNAQPENIDYRYDYFRDNCATRVRDIIDQALGGQLRAQSQTLSGTTYRWQALRLMQSMKPIVVGVDIGLGRPADRELTKWETMFLPKQLHDFVATMQVRDSTGAMHPLVRDERVLFASTRGPEHDAPPHLFPWLLLGGARDRGCVPLARVARDRRRTRRARRRGDRDRALGVRRRDARRARDAAVGRDGPRVRARERESAPVQSALADSRRVDREVALEGPRRRLDAAIRRRTRVARRARACSRM